MDPLTDFTETNVLNVDSYQLLFWNERVNRMRMRRNRMLCVRVCVCACVLLNISAVFICLLEPYVLFVTDCCLPVVKAVARLTEVGGSVFCYCLSYVFFFFYNCENTSKAFARVSV